MKITGCVEFYDVTKCFGKISASSAQGLVFVHRNDIADGKYKYLVKGETVEFELVTSEKGLAAKNVERTEPRFTGVVNSFDHKKGFGTIVTEDGFAELFVHYNDIVTQRHFRTLEEGESVDFVIRKGTGANHRASLVTSDERTQLARFALLPKWNEQLEHLAKKLAQKEDWDYKHTEHKQPLPILHNYLHYTFARVKEEDKISYATDDVTHEHLSSFNTGLVTTFYEPIFSVFRENRTPNPQEKWILKGFFKESQSPMTSFPTHPERANYFNEPTELIYDRRLKLVKNVDHIVQERIVRFPEKYMSSPGSLPPILNMAVEQAERRVAANYKTAIPQFSRGRIQLLLPLCLEDPSHADLALVVAREAAVYKGYTVLTLDMAYNNARLLTRPDDEWLVP